jgi:hypothetical protein
VTVAANQPTTLRCLDNRVEVQAGPGALPPQTTLTCQPIEPGSVPKPQGDMVGDAVFELTSRPATGDRLPARVNLAVTYPEDAVAPEDRDRLALAYLDGTRWTRLPEQANDVNAHRVSATVDRAGVYVLHRQP